MRRSHHIPQFNTNVHILHSTSQNQRVCSAVYMFVCVYIYIYICVCVYTCVCVCVCMCVCVCEGEAGPNIIMWMDHRAEKEAARINSTGHSVLRYVGGTMSLEMQPPKLLWLKEVQ